jgi:PadR family transcriptional regulator, regulatory protein PadR
MAKSERDLYGTIELLVLKALSWAPAHGFGVARWIEVVSRDELRVEEGSLYPALHRLEAEGWIEAEWGVSANRRRAKFYALTPLGRRMLRAEEGRWRHFVDTMARVLAATPSPRAGRAGGAR